MNWFLVITIAFLGTQLKLEAYQYDCGAALWPVSPSSATHNKQRPKTTAPTPKKRSDKLESAISDNRGPDLFYLSEEARRRAERDQQISAALSRLEFLNVDPLNPPPEALILSAYQRIAAEIGKVRQDGTAEERQDAVYENGYLEDAMKVLRNFGIVKN